ncbi:hypothetical protein P3X46_018923 [Hevea brasiliensis]|uniref:Uncharacterized protein n=1 Tax=Hevea brasiliensis TaxID=3981 RepID=A0ABQ9LW32_HEVBR|nr:hypothetical protein P3X46_018923 [Hevea brasiliensis]
MASYLKLWVCLVFFLLTFAKSETRLLVPYPYHHLHERKNASAVFQELQEISKALKVRLGNETVDDQYFNESKRASPGGPDPKHH